MQNEQLKTYILSQIRAGISNQDITTQLQQAGWDDAIIAAAFQATSATVTPVFTQPTPLAPSTSPIDEKPDVAPIDATTITADDPELSSIESEPSTEPLVSSETPITSTVNTQSSPSTTSALGTAALSSAPDATTNIAAEKVELPPPLKQNRLKTGWQLFKQSFRIISNNPVLYRYVIFSVIASVLLFALFIVIIVVDAGSANLLTTKPEGVDEDSTTTLLGIVTGILYMFINTTIAYFFATALSAHVLTIFRGKPSTISENLSLAWKKLPAIATYALISTIVGYILRMIEQRFKLLGRLISAVLGAAWSLATTFTLPVIADTDSNGVASIKESMKLFKDNWGQTIVGRVSIGGLVFIIYLFVMIPLTFIVGFMAMSVFGPFGFFIALALFVFSLVTLIIIEILVTNVLNVCLYYFAKYNAIPPSFDPQLLASAFVAKKPKK
ncbi:MAG: hypothetical protein EOO17_03775 [Chloroflexi bacterium]|nr:MAG: hypothetical protein EOO17_03775 [Chloroflexota bacterium]